MCAGSRSAEWIGSRWAVFLTLCGQHYRICYVVIFIQTYQNAILFDLLIPQTRMEILSAVWTMRLWFIYSRIKK